MPENARHGKIRMTTTERSCQLIPEIIILDVLSSGASLENSPF